jgi:hypothetical protein
MEESTTTLQQLITVTLKSKNEESAYKAILKIKTVPPEIAEWFSKHYRFGKDGKILIQEEAFSNFYFDVINELM